MALGRRDDSVSVSAPPRYQRDYVAEAGIPELVERTSMRDTVSRENDRAFLPGLGVSRIMCRTMVQRRKKHVARLVHQLGVPGWVGTLEHRCDKPDVWILHLAHQCSAR
jgi:hypothetical protein